MSNTLPPFIQFLIAFALHCIAETKKCKRCFFPDSQSSQWLVVLLLLLAVSVLVGCFLWLKSKALKKQLKWTRGKLNILTASRPGPQTNNNNRNCLCCLANDFSSASGIIMPGLFTNKLMQLCRTEHCLSILLLAWLLGNLWL